MSKSQDQLRAAGDEAAAKPNGKQRAVRGGSWSAAGALCEEGISFFLTAVLARLLTPSEFGMYGAVAIFLSLSLMFSESAISQAIIRQKNLNDKHLGVAFTYSTLISLIFGLVYVITADFWANFFGEDSISGMIYTVAAIAPFAAAANIYLSVIEKSGKFHLAAASSLPGMFVGGVASIWLAHAGYGGWSIILGVCLQHVIVLITRVLMVGRIFIPSVSPSEFSDLSGFIYAQSAAQFVNYIARNGDNVVVGRYLGLSPLGIYSRAYKLMMAPVGLASRIGDRVLYPIMAEQGRTISSMRRGYKGSVWLFFSVLAPSSVFMAIMAGEIVELIFGRGWAQMEGPASVLLLSVSFRAIYKQVNVPVLVMGNSRILIVNNAIYAVCVVAGSIASAVIFNSLYAVSISVLISIIVFYVISAWSSNKELSVSWREFLWWHIPATVMSALVAVIVFSVKSVLPANWPPVITLAAAGLAFSAFFAFALAVCGRLILGPSAFDSLQNELKTILSWRLKMKRS